jgi:hypothetical protein
MRGNSSSVPAARPLRRPEYLLNLQNVHRPLFVTGTIRVERLYKKI